jgi:hypothetical protein
METVEYGIRATGPIHFRTHRPAAPPRAGARIGFWIALWGASIAAATSSFWSYSQIGDMPSGLLPSAERIAAVGLEPGCITLIIGLHPHCPCTRGISEELNRLAAESEDYRFVVLASCPQDAMSSWMDTPSIRELERLPRTRIIADECGMIASSLGMIRSGHVIVIGADGFPRYSGGMTSSPLHSLGRPAREAATEVAVGTPLSATTAMVFGCPLVSVSDCEEPVRSAQ